MESKVFFMIVSASMLLGACKGPVDADLIVSGGKIYTVSDQFAVAEAMAVKDGKILATGSREEIESQYRAEETLDLNGSFVYPGFIDAHCHFLGYGASLRNADLVGTTSFQEIIEILRQHHSRYPSEWVLGRGWDQNDWPEKEFPHRRLLDEAFPDNPVLITRIDGHAAIANRAALDLAGVTASSFVSGGEVITLDGEPTGVLIDNAISLVRRMIPEPGREQIAQSLKSAEKNCFAVGLTSVHDAGLSREEVEIMDSLQQSGELKMRIYAMLTPSEENYEKYISRGNYRTDRLNVRSIKLFADGALGSRGAMMIEPYTDDPGNRGLLLTEKGKLEEMCRMAYENNYQVNTHCIGDSANRLMLEIYGSLLGGTNDRRWRIEHAQIVHPGDFELFGKYSVVPSIQTTHATSDMYWAEDRVGPQRITGAYAYRQLLEQNGWIPNGSDFPVEHINPLFGFYAAVARKDQQGYPEGGFQMDNALTREEAMRAMTIWAAMSGFEENEKGSLEPGKFADFVVLDTDLMEAEVDHTWQSKVKMTFSGGEKVFDAAQEGGDQK